MDNPEDIVPDEGPQENIVPIDIGTEMQKSYLDYAMSVIAGRALPDVRDGLKPVHRRVLFTMNQMGLYPREKFVKSAQVVGRTMGEFHPHGDSAIYDTLVRLAQDFSLRYPLVFPQGNFGSPDNPSAAAMRYTECKLHPLAMEMLGLLGEGTVEYVPNYDGSKVEPTVLPTRFPNLLANGTTGIAVGMATNIPSHNLNELVSGLRVMLHNPDVTVDELMEHIPAPDFATGGKIIGNRGIRQAYHTGRGSIRMRGEIEAIENRRGTTDLIVTALPYGVKPSQFYDKVKGLIKDKTIPEIKEAFNKSKKGDVRVIIHLRPGSVVRVVINKLYKMTPLQSSFGVNAIALVQGSPKVMSLKEMMRHYLDHLIEIELRRAVFEYEKIEARMHILEGLLKALGSIDRVIQIIRSSDDSKAAREKLMEEIGLSELQAQAILSMTLASLTKLSGDKTQQEYDDLGERAAYLKPIIEEEDALYEVVEATLVKIVETFGDERRTEILPDEEDFDFDEESMIQDDDALVIITKKGYIKRMSPDEIKSQARGGVGVAAMSLNEDDAISHVIGMTLHQYLLLVTDEGKMYRIKGYQIPEGSRQAKGRALVNMLPLAEGETVKAVLKTKDYTDRQYIVFYSQNGVVKRSMLTNYKTSRLSDGIKALNLLEGDSLVGAVMADEGDTLLLASAKGRALRFSLEKVRASGRTSGGVRGMRLEVGDHLVGAVTGSDDDYALVVTRQGYGKRVKLSDYGLKGRGGSGVRGFGNVDKRGLVVDTVMANDDTDFILINSVGTVLRTQAENAPVQSRTSSGVRLNRLRKNTEIVAVSIVPAGGESLHLDQGDIPDDLEDDLIDDLEDDVIEDDATAEDEAADEETTK